MIKDLLVILAIVSVNVINRDFGEYLDYKNYKCRKRFVDKFAEECTENIDETRLVEINSTECNSV